MGLREIPMLLLLLSEGGRLVARSGISANHRRLRKEELLLYILLSLCKHRQLRCVTSMPGAEIPRENIGIGDEIGLIALQTTITPACSGHHAALI